MKQKVLYTKGTGCEGFEELIEDSDKFETCIHCSLTRKDAAIIIETLARQFTIFENANAKVEKMGFGLILFGDMEDICG